MTETEFEGYQIRQKNTMYLLMIDDLIRSIKEQNLEIVALRRLLSNYMKPKCQQDMKFDFYNSLYPKEIPISYDSFIQEDCNGEDPFEEPEYLRKMKRYAAGKTTADHPCIRTRDPRKQ